MASSNLAKTSLLLLALVSLSRGSYGFRKLNALSEPDKSELLSYHNGAVLQGDILVSIFWYGNFTSSQKSIVSDFLLSLSPTSKLQPRVSIPSLSQWWDTVNQLYLAKAGKKKASIFLAKQFSDVKCSMGKTLKMSQIPLLAAKSRPEKGGVALVFTAKDVAVEGFCSNRCGSHGSDASSGLVYVWVGNSAAQCPGQCAWPFHQPIYGPQTLPLLPPNGDAGVDGVIMSLATLLAGAVTNPQGDGFFQGPKAAPLEAATACPGVYAKGAYPGYAGDLLVDPTSGASYNANGVHGRKYVVPALFDPSTSTCSTLV